MQQEQSSPDGAHRPKRRPRSVEVRHVKRVGGRFARVTLGGPDLDGFAEPGPTQHVKLVIPDPGQDANTYSGSVDDGPSRHLPRPRKRTYTVGDYRPLDNEIDIDILLHGGGAASAWAEHLRPGHRTVLSGPGGRGYSIPTDTDHLLLAGDETAMPALVNLIKALPAGTNATVVVEAHSQQILDELAGYGQVRASLLKADPAGPPGARLTAECHRIASAEKIDAAWVACEATAMREIRVNLLAAGHPPERMVTRGYWKQGTPNYPDHDYGQDHLNKPRSR